MRLRDKVAIITGGGTGIGHATAILLAGEGATAMIAGVKQQTIEETAAAITSEGGRSSIVLPSQDTSASVRWALTMQQREVWNCSANVWLLISLSTKSESTQSALAGWG